MQVIDGHTGQIYIMDDVDEDPTGTFKIGDKVMVNNVHSLYSPQDGLNHPEWIRVPQTIESVRMVPVNNYRGYVLSIDLVGIPYVFKEEDLEVMK